MRLLSTFTFQLCTFVSSETRPDYAILSHCWDDDEVVFSDIQDLARARAHPSWLKVERACTAARAQGYDWLWLDTCCIDKSSSAELSEALNSMFTWYGRAGLCLAYLSDVGDDDPHGSDSSFRNSRWFTRGWTLQELVAPGRSVVFLSGDWTRIGSSPELAALLEQITNIDAAILLSDHPGREIAKRSLARRMSWAAGRNTTRPEDRAYALMGIFDVNIPVLYGEGGERAFRRLQIEIIQHSYDTTIFAWGPRGMPAHTFARPNSDSGSRTSWKYECEYLWPTGLLLALSPDAFRASADLVRVSLAELPSALGIGMVDEPHFYYTHLGIRIPVPLCEVYSHEHGRFCCAALACRTSGSGAGVDGAPLSKFIGLILYRTHDNPLYFPIRSPDLKRDDGAAGTLSRVIELPYPLAGNGSPEWKVESIYIYAKAFAEEAELLHIGTRNGSTAILAQSG